MKLTTVHKRMLKSFPKAHKRISKIFLDDRDKKKCNALIRDEYPKLHEFLIKRIGRTVFKIKPDEFHTIITGEQSTVCACSGCSNMTGYDKGKRKFKEFCSKACTRKSGVIRERREATMLKRYGVVNAYQSPEVQEKIAKTNKQRYGTANASSSKKIKDKRKATMQARYGVDSPMESQAIRDNQTKAMLEKHGVSNCMHLDSTKQAIKATCQERYGVDCVMHDADIAERTHKRSIEGSMAKYGVPNAMLHPDVIQKWHQSFGHKSEFEICGKTVRVQGYEQFALEYLHATKPFKNITTSPKGIGTVPYTHEGKPRRYVPDAAIQMMDGSVRVIEVKSWFTLKSKLNVSKFKAATKYFNARGSDFVLVIAEPKSGYVQVVYNPSRNLNSLVKAAELFCSGRRTW